MGIKDASFVVRGTTQGTNVTLGPAMFEEEGGKTSCTLFLTIVSNTEMIAREEWTWTDVRRRLCLDGTADIEMTRIG